MIAAGLDQTLLQSAIRSALASAGSADGTAPERFKLGIVRDVLNARGEPSFGTAHSKS
jgi:hypothetical protein